MPYPTLWGSMLPTPFGGQPFQPGPSLNPYPMASPYPAMLPSIPKPLTPKNDEGPPNPGNDTPPGTNTGGGAGGGAGGGSGQQGGTTDQLTIRNAIGRALNSQWQDPQFLQTYGNYKAQFPNQSTQIGAGMYSNIQPMQYVPPWAVQNLPSRLSGPGYLNGGSVANYGSAFGNKWGTGPRAIGNPYPGNGYALQNMNVQPAWSNGLESGNYNPFTRNQQGNWPWGAPGGAGNPSQNAQASGISPQMITSLLGMFRS